MLQAYVPIHSEMKIQLHVSILKHLKILITEYMRLVYRSLLKNIEMGSPLYHCNKKAKIDTATPIDWSQSLMSFFL